MDDSSPPRTPDRQARLERVRAAYLDSVESGQPFDRDALITANPELADDLRSFFRSRDEAPRLAEPLQRPPTRRLVLGGVLLLGAVASADYSLYWFRSALEPRVQVRQFQKQLAEAQRQRASGSRNEAAEMTMMFGMMMGLGANSLDVGLLTAESAALSAEKSAYQYLCLALALGFPGWFFLRFPLYGSMPVGPPASPTTPIARIKPSILIAIPATVAGGVTGWWAWPVVNSLALQYWDENLSVYRLLGWIGAMLCGATAFALITSLGSSRRVAGRLLIVAALAGISWLAPISWGSIRGVGSFAERALSLAIFGLPLLWAFLLGFWGYRMQRKYR